MFVANIQTDELRAAAQAFSRLETEITRLRRELPRRIADEVLVVEAEASFERAGETSLAPSTLADLRARGNPDRIRRRRPRPSRKRHGYASRPLSSRGGKGLYAALTASWQQRGPVALREISGSVMTFGTKRWVDGWADLHRSGTKHMPARLDFAESAASVGAIEEGIRELIGDAIVIACERAGLPREWHQRAAGGLG